MTLLAGPAAVAVRNARLFRLQQEQNRYLGSLLATARAITSTVTLEDSLSRICRTAAEALETEECVIYEYDAAARRHRLPRASTGATASRAGLDEAGVYPLDDYPTDREILRRGEVRAGVALRRGPARRTCAPRWSSGARRRASTCR